MVNALVAGMGFVGGEEGGQPAGVVFAGEDPNPAFGFSCLGACGGTVGVEGVYGASGGVGEGFSGAAGAAVEYVFFDGCHEVVVQGSCGACEGVESWEVDAAFSQFVECVGEAVGDGAGVGHVAGGGDGGDADLDGDVLGCELAGRCGGCGVVR
ncbi:hypothetical protein FRAHR75_50076 [Frankia sp. Hr75.2]|nr:hypothetical protein FRAHR75_50076 [Frankia sp. Hr75.2]